jgi:hypothetical protein
MTLPPDKSELVLQITDTLEERIEAGQRLFYCSTHTKSDYSKHLIEPLSKKYRIEPLLEYLPHRIAKSLREKYSRLMSCF